MDVIVIDPKEQAQACIIWMHGLGADAQDMVGLVNQLALPAPVRHVFPNAPTRPVTINNGMMMRAWYDILDEKFSEIEDRDGILQSERIIQRLIEEQLELGFESKQVMLAGFSQGGAMALFSGLRYTQPLGGIISLCAYVPIANECRNYSYPETPIFMANGEFDPLVLPKWAEMSKNYLLVNGVQHLTFKSYLMEHSVCEPEIGDLRHWLMEDTLLRVKA